MGVREAVADDLVAKFQLKDEQELASIFAWPRRYARERGQRKPVLSRQEQGRTIYSLDPVAKELSQKAKTELSL
jgi:hypothetical protein